jgi:predicted flap endonuclease-1-like 5' DNA nuclease
LKSLENYLNPSVEHTLFREKNNMRSDYALYAVAIIFFVITGISFAVGLAELERNLWVVTTAVLGLLFAGLGYTQRPRPRGRIIVEAPPSTPAQTSATPTLIAPVSTTPEPAPTEPAAPAVTEVKEENIEVTTEAAPTVLGLTEVKGIGEKRKQQLNALGINSIDDLAKASANELAQKLKISPKISGKWIENAKTLLEKS